MNVMYKSIIIALIFGSISFAQNYSLSFDGSSYVSVPHSNSLNLGNKFTIECWFTVKGTHSTSDWIGIIGKTEASYETKSGYELGLLEPSGDPLPTSIHFQLWNYPADNDVNSSFTPIVNTWYHLAVTYDNSLMSLYLNGNLVQQITSTAPILNDSLPLTIGGQNGNYWNRNLYGNVDEVRISSNVRYTSNFVPSTYFQNDSNTEALYHFNEGSGNILYDASGNGNNGVINGATWSNDVPNVLTSTQNENSSIPKVFLLSQNYPNPFNPSTIIRYVLPSESKIKITVYNILGQEIKTLLNTTETAGYHEITFNANNLASGIYFYRIVATSADGKHNFADTKKLILMK